MVGMAISQTVADLGYEVVGMAADAEQALDLARRERPDLVLMDISLGSGPDGVEAAGNIAALMAVKVIFLTAHTDPQTVARVRESQLGAILSKPFTDDQLAQAITDLFGSGSAGS